MTTPAPKSANDDSSGSRLDSAKESITDAYASASKTVGSALDDARERLSTTLDTSRDTVSDLRRRASDRIEASPVAALVGGLALGAIAAVLLPRSEREIAALSSLGNRVSDAARDAFSAGKDAGRSKLAEVGLNQDNLQDTVGRFISDIISAATTAASAASTSVKDSTARS